MDIEKTQLTHEEQIILREELIKSIDELLQKYPKPFNSGKDKNICIKFRVKYANVECDGWSENHPKYHKGKINNEPIWNIDFVDELIKIIDDKNTNLYPINLCGGSTDSDILEIFYFLF